MTRAVLVALCVLILLLALAGMRWGWRNRLARQAHLPPLPEVPADPGPALLRLEGVYVGTTYAGRWQERIAHARLGERAEAVATLHAAGVLIERTGSTPVFLPHSDLLGARLAPGLAGKVVGEGGLVVLRWRLGDAELDTGLRADDKTGYPHWVRAIEDELRARMTHARPGEAQ